MLTDLTLAEITVDGAKRRLTDDEAADFGNLLVSAGTETVAKLLGWAAVLLDEHPDQRDEVAADFSLIPSAPAFRTVSGTASSCPSTKRSVAGSTITARCCSTSHTSSTESTSTVT